MPKSKPCLILTLRDGTPVSLYGRLNKELVIKQVTTNRILRRLYDLLGFDLIVSTLLVRVKTDLGDVEIVDTAAILVKHFEPCNEAEKKAVAESEAAVLAAKRIEKKDARKAERIRAYANEMLWLAIAGCLKDQANAQHYSENKKEQKAKEAAGNRISTWEPGSSEPMYGLGLYENF